MAHFRKKGANIDIKGIVIHQINKTSGDRNTGIKEATDEILVTDNERIFIADAHESYYKKSSPNYGIFGNENPGFKDALKKYVNNECNFLAFTKSAIFLYKTEISKSAPASGGFVVFAHYVNKDSGNNNLLVLTTNNKDGFAINEAALTIEGIKTLDMSKVDVACLINLSKWEDAANQEDPNDSTYLSFVRGNKEVSVYFMTFIDCNDKTTSLLSSKRLLKAIDGFIKSKEWDRKLSRAKKNDIYMYCDKCITNHEGIHLSVVSSLIYPENPDEFTEYASSEDVGVSAIISGKRSELKQLKSIYYKGPQIVIGFDRSLLNSKDKQQPSIKYNTDRGELIIKNLPQELVEQIDK